jgi:carboxymethylenebutenolidase
MSKQSIVAALALLLACTPQGAPAPLQNPTGASNVTTARTVAATSDDKSLPADAAHVTERLVTSPRHGEWALIRTPEGDSVKAWVVYPERSSRAPVVIVIHEIYGLSSWVRGVADQLAASGYIAVAPDLLTMANVTRTADTVSQQDAVAAFRTLDMNAAQRQIDAVAKYAMALPAALPRYGIVGFCRGGDVSFAHSAHSPSVSAAVVYYGVWPGPDKAKSIKAPVLGLYGGNDARVDATISQTDSVLRAIGKTYVHSVYDSAGHGFLRQQDGMNGANLRATRQAWPATLAWFKQYLGS